jgi:hypothetical protein
MSQSCSSLTSNVLHLSLQTKQTGELKVISGFPRQLECLAQPDKTLGETALVEVELSALPEALEDHIGRDGDHSALFETLVVVLVSLLRITEGSMRISEELVAKGFVALGVLFNELFDGCF